VIRDIQFSAAIAYLVFPWREAQGSVMGVTGIAFEFDEPVFVAFGTNIN
jgi:hypothetical protein